MSERAKRSRKLKKIRFDHLDTIIITSETGGKILKYTLIWDRGISGDLSSYRNLYLNSLQIVDNWGNPNLSKKMFTPEKFIEFFQHGMLVKESKYIRSSYSPNYESSDKTD